MNSHPSLVLLAFSVTLFSAVTIYVFARRVRRYRMPPHAHRFTYGSAPTQVCQDGIPAESAMVLSEADGTLFTTAGRFRRHPRERGLWVCVRDPRVIWPLLQPGHVEPAAPRIAIPFVPPEA